jgi:F0F1-type ATP synthase membrane subunit b/b'
MSVIAKIWKCGMTKRIEKLLDRRIQQAHHDLEQAKRKLRSAKNPVGAAVAEWVVKRAETELGYLLHWASPAEN